MGEVDPAFVQDPEHRPKLLVNKAEGIPLIDLSAIKSEGVDPEAIEVVVREIGSACKEWGFLQVINHGVPLEIHQKVETEARKSFALPLEEKRKVRRDEWSALGYYDTELTKNVRDWKEVFDFALDVPTFVPASPDPDHTNLMKWTNQWPQNPPQFREACEEYSREVEKLSLKILELIAQSLRLGANRGTVATSKNKPAL